MLAISNSSMLYFTQHDLGCPGLEEVQHETGMKNADSVWRQGGAVFMRDGTSATFTSCPFTSNTATQHGCVSIYVCVSAPYRCHCLV